jgi:hypothetical protein
MTSATAERFDPEDNPAAHVGKCRLTRDQRGGETRFPKSEEQVATICTYSHKEIEQS